MGAGGAAAPADTQMRLPPVPPLYAEDKRAPEWCGSQRWLRKRSWRWGGEGPSPCACRETQVWPWLHVREPRRLSAPHLCLPDQAVGTSHEGPRRVM